MSKLVTGVYAAVLTPRNSDGSLDENGLGDLLGFLSGQGLDGFAINGATGEFCLTSAEELERILAVTRSVVGKKVPWLCGVGSAGLAGCLQLGRIAAQYGATGLLLPMPYFFPYHQADLRTFCLHAAHELPLPVLLYNLPKFSSGLEPQTSVSLISECREIIGIKDSSGSLDTLCALTRTGIDCCRIVGNDSVLSIAVQEGVCDGVVSGVAGVVPELVRAVYDSVDGRESPQRVQAVAALDELLTQIGDTPVPWGLKWIAESRGIARATFAQPLSAERIAQGERFMEWFRNRQTQIVRGSGSIGTKN